ncbi:M43 family zinc metalloprotease [Tenacibaculum agarivorans]|uniref:M43 family zinc metalloprotease n=1 Tax=Tenacibaculum agarivorans TaxID=1908389 RepID=UPI00094B97FC|nr:M43 family zinc metalloprotease [Tenacibaculum agarivorans]
MKETVSFFIFLFFLSCSSEDTGVKLNNEPNDTIILPIVVHIIHSGEEVGDGSNISEYRVFEQIESLNNDFRKRKGTLGYNTHVLGVDTKIEFKLAEIDPQRQKTKGINRINSYDVTIKTDPDNPPLPFDLLPQYAYWNPEKYINIWVLKGPKDLFLGSSQFPYAKIPGLQNPLNTIGTGIFINTLHFGKSDIDSKINLGRTLTHEMGHFLGLEHLWGKKESSDCLEYDDYVKDTPPVGHSNTDCDNTELSCNGESSILIHNYMDYSPDACMNMFTKGQAERMRYVLENSTDRKSLATSNVINRY